MTASNLKWAMGSNSLVFCEKMRCETWFMEVALRAEEHLCCSMSQKFRGFDEIL